MARPLTITVEPGVDTSIPTGPQMSAKFTLTGPDGTRAVLNDQLDRDYIGMATEITGFDSPDVRENADDLVQMDGGIHGDFFYGRRPITLTGLFLNPASVDDRNRRMTKLMRASNAMRADAILSWALDGLGGVKYEQFVAVRRQQPLRMSGGWQKDFQLSLVAADPRIYSTTFNIANVLSVGGSGTQGRSYLKGYPIDYGTAAVAGQVLVTNAGNATTYPILTVYGPGSNPYIYNFTNGGVIALNYTLGSADYLTIDTLNRTVLLNNTSSRYAALDFLNTKWFGLDPGVNDIRLAWTSFSSPASLAVQYRDAWL